MLPQCCPNGHLRFPHVLDSPKKIFPLCVLFGSKLKQNKDLFLLLNKFWDIFCLQRTQGG